MRHHRKPFFSRNDSEFPERDDHSGKGPRGYRRSDQRVYEDVCEVLARAGHIDASEIEVSVKDGVVFLDGVVEDRQMKREAERVLDYLPGVEDVQNRLGTKRTRDALSQLTGDGRSHDEGLVKNRTSMM